MTNQPTNQPLPTQIATPAAQSLALLTRIAEAMEIQNNLLAGLREQIEHLIETSDATAESNATVAEGFAAFTTAMATWTQAPAPATGLSAPAPAASGPTVVFMAESVGMGFDEKSGQPVYKIRGGSYRQFGVRVWPEALPLLGIDAADLKPGINPFCKPVVALMGEKGPRKVIGLAN